jgi:acyl carrier protein
LRTEGGDSLEVVELVMALGEGFSCEESDQDAEKLRNVGEVIKYIEAHQPK